VQYLLDMDVMKEGNHYHFTFSPFKITPLMLACAIGQ